MPFITQRQAKKQMREATGMSEKFCQQIIGRLPKKQDGARKKLHTETLRETIAEINGFRSQGVTQRPKSHLSARTRNRIRAGALA